MGFFASRWIEKHGAANEKAALTTITNGLSGPSISESEGAGTVKSKWVSPIARGVRRALPTSDVQRSNERAYEPAGGSPRERRALERSRFGPLPTCGPRQ